MNSKRKTKGTKIDKVVSNLRIAIVMDSLLKFGGAERVLEEMLKVYPNADVYTAISDEKFVKSRFPNVKIVNSFIQKIPFEKYLRRELFLLYPIAYRLFSFWNYDVVISQSASFAKFVRPWKKATKHIAYILTPPRFFWIHESRSTIADKSPSYKFYSFFIGSFLEKIWQYWDRKAAAKADYRIVNSKTIQDRVKKFYNLDSEVLYPPVPMENIALNRNNKTRKNWFLYHGRVETYKGVDLLIKACAVTGSPLKISGIGGEFENLKKLANSLNTKGLIKFLGYPTDEEYRNLFFDCKAAIFPVKDEDFGIVQVEANAAGAPVIAYRGGGSMETLSEANPKTAIFFDEYSVDSLANAILKFKSSDFDPVNCRKQAELFSADIFRYKFKNYVEDVVRNS